MRQINTHKINASTTGQLELFCLDSPGSGGASHNYHISSSGQGQFVPVNISFQNGVLPEKGVNGVTQEILLAIVKDRLEGFQSGPFACESNALALGHVEFALNHLKNRTLQRVNQGVEGKLENHK